MTQVACDVSYFQPRVDDSYPHRWLILRACDGDFEDPNAAYNLAWCKRRATAGALDGWTLYAVYRPGKVAASLAILDRLGLAGAHVMVDVESWQGQISGDHSADIASFVQQLAARVGWGRVWAYANRGDFASIFPRRDPRVGLVVASYGGSRPANPGPGPMVGWQYTDGQYQVPGLPSSSPPFGPCDHNELYVTATAAAAASVAPVSSLGVDVYELIRDEQGGVYQVTALVFRHVPNEEEWRVLSASPLNVSKGGTRQVNNRERDVLHATVSANVAALRG
jgi:hypothetical protein